VIPLTACPPKLLLWQRESSKYGGENEWLKRGLPSPVKEALELLVKLEPCCGAEDCLRNK